MFIFSSAGAFASNVLTDRLALRLVIAGGVATAELPYPNPGADRIAAAAEVDNSEGFA